MVHCVGHVQRETYAKKNKTKKQICTYKCLVYQPPICYVFYVYICYTIYKTYAVFCISLQTYLHYCIYFTIIYGVHDVSTSSVLNDESVRVFAIQNWTVFIVLY